MPAHRTPSDYSAERTPEGAIRVRMHSAPRSTDPGEPAPPQAVFTFRAGDAQFARWDRLLRDRPAKAA